MHYTGTTSGRAIIKNTNLFSGLNAVVLNPSNVLGCKTIVGSGTLQNLRAKVDVAPGAGESLTLEIWVNGTATGISAVIADTDTSAVDTTNTFSVTDGDLAQIKVIASANMTTIPNLIWGIDA